MSAGTLISSGDADVPSVILGKLLVIYREINAELI
jgi:hypothetical protein